MKCIIRADSSDKMGSGHLMRCLTLAAELREVKKADILFICRDLPGSMAYLVEENGYDLCLLAYDESRNAFLNGLDEHKQWLGVTLNSDRDQTIAEIGKQGKYDLMVVDHYALDEAWETPMRQYVKKIMVIDDLADRKHDCDILLDQNFYKRLEVRYKGLVPSHCKTLLGPKFALLRREFRSYRPKKPKIVSTIKKILVNFGGSDPKNHCLKLIEMLYDNQDFFSRYHFLFVTGSMSSCKSAVFQISNKLSFCDVVEQTNKFGEIMRQADLFIGAVGATSWERGFLSLPAIVCSVAKNQDDIARDGDNLFHCVVDFNSSSACLRLKSILSDIKYINQLSKAAYDVISKVCEPRLLIREI